MEALILALDCGTQSLRVAIINARGELLAIRKIVYEPYFSLRPGWAEQDPEKYWNCFCQGCQTLKIENPKLWEQVSAVVVTTLRDTAVNMSKEGKTLRPVITWLDQRKAQFLETLSVKDRLLFQMIGMKKTVGIIRANAKSNWLRENEPDLWKATYKFVMLSGLFYFRLTGVWKDSVASQIGHFPFDYKNQCWEKSDQHWKWQGFGIERDKLAELVDPGSMIGEITQIASEQTGIRKGTAVIAAGSDKGCENIGSGCLQESDASMSFGTTATVQITTSKYIEPIQFMPPYPALIKGYYNPEIEIFRGYWMISWFKKEFAMEEVLQAQQLNVSPEELLNRRLNEIPPGSQGLLVQPFWGPHVKTPWAKGAMIGFGEVHTRIHIYRAIIEGINYALIEGLEKIEKKTKTPIEHIHVSGGGAQSETICQITADMFGKNVYQPLLYETSSLGAAMVGFVALKTYPDFPTAMKNMVKYKKIYPPNLENFEIYRKLYEKAYTRMYPKLKSLYHHIKEIIHYPEN